MWLEESQLLGIAKVYKLFYSITVLLQSVLKWLDRPRKQQALRGPSVVFGDRRSISITGWIVRAGSTGHSSATITGKCIRCATYCIAGRSGM